MCPGFDIILFRGNQLYVMFFVSEMRVHLEILPTKMSIIMDSAFLLTILFTRELTDLTERVIAR